MIAIDNLIKWFQEELRDCKTVLDLGCGPDSIIQFVDTVEYSVGIDYWQPSVDRSAARGIHNICCQGDITTIAGQENSFDAVILVDVLEHLTTEEGMKLLNDMTRWASKKVIVVVPNGELAQDTDDEGNEKQKHLSAWYPATLESFGFKVRGFDGWKQLRGEHGNIIPTRTRAGHYALSALSLMSDPFVRNRPNLAFHLFAVYRK